MVAPKVGPKVSEVGPYPPQVGPKVSEVGPKPDFVLIYKNYRKDFRATYRSVWDSLLIDSTLTKRELSVRLKLAASSVLSAMNALQEVVY